jgi:TIR domain
MATTGTTFPNPLAGARDLVFISYSHHDQVWLERLLIFLKPYTRQNLQVWADPYIKVGDRWWRNISEALSRACVGVLLVSPNFINSDFIFHMWTAPSLQGVLQCFDQIACAHMSGLFVRSHMNAGQDGFRDKSSKQNVDLIESHWKMRIVSRRGSIDHTICSSSCKFWHQLSTVAVELLPVSG